jgi:hypothetical protein
MNIDDREFVEKTARLVFAELVGRNKTETAGDKTGLLRGYAAIAWQGADVLLEQRKEHKMGKYTAILQNYEGAEALRRVLEMGGNMGRGLDYMVGRYAGKPDPLRAFAEENIGPRTAGQEAVAEYLKHRRADV